MAFPPLFILFLERPVFGWVTAKAAHHQNSRAQAECSAGIRAVKEKTDSDALGPIEAQEQRQHQNRHRVYPHRHHVERAAVSGTERHHRQHEQQPGVEQDLKVGIGIHPEFRSRYLHPLQPRPRQNDQKDREYDKQDRYQDIERPHPNTHDAASVQIPPGHQGQDGRNHGGRDPNRRLDGGHDIQDNRQNRHQDSKCQHGYTKKRIFLHMVTLRHAIGPPKSTRIEPL